MAVEKRGAKKLEEELVVDVVEAETIRLIFRLLQVGNDSNGPMGVKSIACWLNERGYQTRKGGAFGVSGIHRILTNPVYVGEWVFNKRNSRTGRVNPEQERITVAVPPIIDRPEFDSVAAMLKSRDPRVVAPRAVTGPILLTGLAVCGSCRGAMTLRTGTSSTGQVHRYDTCSTCARKGKTVCTGRSIPMERLDQLVTDSLVDRLLQPERLTGLLATLADRRERAAAETDGRIVALQSEVAEAEDKLRRMCKIVETGLTDLDDILQQRLTNLKLDRERARTALDRVLATAVRPIVIDPAAVESFGRMMRQNITTGETPFRKVYLRAVVDHVEVDDHVIRIIGDKTTLEQAIAGQAANASDVRRCVPKWRARRDSNARPLPSEGNALSS